MTKQENEAQLQREIVSRKINAYAQLKNVLNFGPSDFKHSGFKSIDDACKSIIKNTEAQIERAIRAYENKWP